jgi:phytoene dehydrogenase-like protein
MESNIHTIVIGSGIAGIAAASTIANSGQHVVVLEANNYIGGRLKTMSIQLSNNSIFQF